MSSIAISEPEATVVAPRSLPMPSGMQIFFGLVAILAVVGALMSGSTMANPAVNQYGQVGDIGISKKTSFGVVAVEHAEQLGGLTKQDLVGANHGVKNLVEQGAVQMQVSISLTNQTSDVLDYSPAQFRLKVGDGSQMADVQSSTFGEGRLQPHTNIEGRMGFVAPADGRDLTLEFDDRGGAPVIIKLGSTASLDKVESHGAHGKSTVDAAALVPPTNAQGLTVDTNSPQPAAAAHEGQK